MSSFELNTAALYLSANITPWDTQSFGFGVAQINRVDCLTSDVGSALLDPFIRWLEKNDIRLVSVRLPCEKLRESMLLERGGFRFVEVALHPYHDLPYPRLENAGELVIEPALHSDVPALQAMASRAFPYGRIHADPRLGAELGDLRYGRWVANCLAHPRQRLLKVTNEDAAIAALFVVEARDNMSVYWHLTAVSPDLRGRGTGWRVWHAMLARHANEGMSSVHTTITASNIPILNLYSKLGFHFSPPEMTFHWMREL